MTSIFLLAAEASGDLLGSQLIPSLRDISPSIKLWGIGGPRIRTTLFESLIPMEQFQMMGFKDCVARLPALIRQFRTIRNQILDRRPDTVILIDYPGFNLRLAKSLRRHGYKGKIVQYVSPTVWVWGKKRIDAIAKYYDQLLCILPFEPPLYAHTGLDVRYVGHPVVEAVETFRQNPAAAHPEKKLLALFPGSRRSEIQNNFPLQLSVAKTLTEKHADMQVAVSCSQTQYRPLIEKMLHNASMQQLTQITDDSYPLMESCHAALAKSGTVTLELSLFNKPAAIVYQVERLNRFIAKHVLRLDLEHVGIVNILAKKTVQPEFVIEPFTMEQLSSTVDRLFSDDDARLACLEGYRQITEILGPKKASKEAARAILTPDYAPNPRRDALEKCTSA